MLIVLTGPASSGKDTVMHKLLKEISGLKRVITTTTRKKRPGEAHGEDYYFVSLAQFEQMVKEGRFVEYVNFFNNLYGTTIKELEPLSKGRDLIWRVETSRAARIKKMSQKLIKDALVLYLTVSDWKILETRMRKRGIPQDKIRKRLEIDKADFQKYGHKFENIIYNQDGKLEKTMAKVMNLINTHKIQKPMPGMG